MGLQVVNVVSGLPRSGTSMMMRMIGAGGIEPLTDGVRGPDDDNPLGYAEFEAVKRTREDASWVGQAPGRVVKLVHLLLRDLPPAFHYRVVLMDRDLDEVLASQRAMLERSRKTGGRVDPQVLKKVFAAQLAGVRAWLGAQPNFSVLEVSYNQVMQDPLAQARRVAEFLGIPGRAGDMAAAVEPSLYRQKKGGGPG
jgi:hypothetical protein